MSPAAIPAAQTHLTTLDAESLALAAVSLLVVGSVLFWFRRRRRDEMYVGLTPGEIPRAGEHVRTRRLGRSGEWNGTVAVRFTPPDDVTPGLAGTVVDGSADHVDLSATLIDLAVRGHLTLTAVRPRTTPDDDFDWSTGEFRTPVPQEPAAPPPPHTPDEAKAVDWELTRHDIDAPLRPFERELLDDIFGGRRSVRLSDLRDSFGMTLRKAQIGLYREVVDRGWYREHPRARNRRLGCLGIPVLLVGSVLLATALVGLGRHRIGPLEATPGIALLVAGGLLLWGGRGRTPRTADGTAVRVQTLGFREYLTTAEADQIRFEEAQDLFSRYLPYAIVFGCAERWSRIFGEVAAKAHLAGVGDVAFHLDWVDGLDVLHAVGDIGLDALQVVDAFDGPGLVDIGSGLGDLAPTDLLDTMTDGLGELASGLGEFVSSMGDLLDGLDGCDGCDGCDIGF